MGTFVETIIAGITGIIDLALVAKVIVIIIGAGIVAIFAWRFARMGYSYIVYALSGYIDYKKEGKRQAYYDKHGSLPDW